MNRPVRIIPCLDIADGRVVKGVQFQRLRDAGDPAERASLYERDGADELALLDVTATSEDRGAAAKTVARVRAVLRVALTVGGGVRSASGAQRLLEAGADKMSVNTAAVERPALIEDLASQFGAQCVVVAIDAARRANKAEWEVVTHAGRRRTGLDAVTWAAKAQALGAGEILLTSWDRDGTRKGYDLALLARVRNATTLPIIASGGAHAPAHMASAFAAGADAALAASIFHDGDWTILSVKQALRKSGVEVRL